MPLWPLLGDARNEPVPANESAPIDESIRFERAVCVCVCAVPLKAVWSWPVTPIDARVALVVRVVLAALVRVRCAVEGSVVGRPGTPIDACVALVARVVLAALVLVIVTLVPLACVWVDEAVKTGPVSHSAKTGAQLYLQRHGHDMSLVSTSFETVKSAPRKCMTMLWGAWQRPGTSVGGIAELSATGVRVPPSCVVRRQWRCGCELEAHEM